VHAKKEKQKRKKNNLESVDKKMMSGTVDYSRLHKNQTIESISSSRIEEEESSQRSPNTVKKIRPLIRRNEKR